MRYFTVTLLFLLISISATSQTIDLSGLQGLKDDKGQIFLEANGYSISITSETGQLDNQKTIDEIKKRYKIKDIIAEYSEPEIGNNNHIIESESTDSSRPKAKYNQAFYIIPKNKTEVAVIFFKTLNQRDILLEQTIVKIYLQNELSEFISESWDAHTISFIGRDIELGNTCKWLFPHNVRCGKGQIRWSEFPSFLEAQLDINNRIDANISNNTSILSEEDIDVIFEDIPSLAHRVVYQQNTMDAKPLIVYYVVQEIRGKYVSCILSQYGYNKDDYELAPVVQQVMNIPSVPEWAYNPFNDPSFEDEEKNYIINLLEVKAGAVIPVGNLSNVFKAAPSIGVYFGMPIKEVMALDLGIQLAFPLNRKPFNYYYHKEVFEDTKTDILGNIDVRFRYQHATNKKDVYWTPYVGTGFAFIQTNLEKDYYEEDSNKWHMINTFNIFGGVGFRYKKVGCYAEYRYNPYSIAGRVRSTFGNSYLNVGMSLCF